MSGRRKILPEAEIQRLERMVGEELTDHLSSLPREELQKHFAQMLSSYRTAARVANAVVKLRRTAPTEFAAMEAALQEVDNTLADYMPNEFTPHEGNLEFLLNTLYAIREEMDGTSYDETVALIENQIEFISKTLREKAARPGEQLSLPKRTPV